MKFQPDTPDADRNAIVAHDQRGIHIAEAGQLRTFAGAVIVPWSGALQDWDAPSREALTEAHFARLADWQPELVIFGSGAKLGFVAPALYRALIQRRIGLETMDTAAACRTYNVLVAEGRRVIAALLPDTQP